jgi:membrane protein DedA with SNARE-associated domain
VDSFICIIAKYSYLGIFIATGLGILGFPIPDETFVAFIGFMTFQGKLYFPVALVVAFMGTSCGITIGYLLGRRYGNPFIEKYSDRMRIGPENLHRAEEFYKKYGKVVLTIGYFIPGVRHVFAILAGISLMSYKTFAVFAYSGGFLWTLTFVSLGRYLGKQWHHVSAYSFGYFVPVAVIVMVILIITLYLKNRKSSR